MSTVKSKKLQVGTDATATNNFTIYQPATPDGTLRVGVGNADSPTEVGRFDSNGYLPTESTSPLVYAYLSANQSVTESVWTKVALDNVVWDTTANFDTTNNRYQPSVAGYYQINTVVQFPVAPANYLYMALYKNGSTYNFLHGVRLSSGLNDWRLNGSIIVDLNGTTDYIELYAYATGTNPDFGGNTNTRETWFQAKLIQRI